MPTTSPTFTGFSLINTATSVSQSISCAVSGLLVNCTIPADSTTTFGPFLVSATWNSDGQVINVPSTPPLGIVPSSDSAAIAVVTGKRGKNTTTTDVDYYPVVITHVSFDLFKRFIVATLTGTDVQNGGSATYSMYMDKATSCTGLAAGDPNFQTNGGQFQILDLPLNDASNGNHGGKHVFSGVSRRDQRVDGRNDEPQRDQPNKSNRQLDPATVLSRAGGADTMDRQHIIVADWRPPGTGGGVTVTLRGLTSNVAYAVAASAWSYVNTDDGLVFTGNFTVECGYTRGLYRFYYTGAPRFSASPLEPKTYGRYSFDFPGPIEIVADAPAGPIRTSADAAEGSAATIPDDDYVLPFSAGFNTRAVSRPVIALSMLAAIACALF
ncbi:hypothetical protein BDZ88DRAFT_438769 [Geranomyces variabilis]|nr:hypothetical protein BDZ88DRAFT_438769 [Geranomyces variabilis]KAJ3142672.1 hypothetical protein HDU90_002539 [Geranomyces variabilis]